jgi:hypothetical protein
MVLSEAGHVGADLALHHHRLLVVVVVLDRVFHRDDVLVEVLVDVVDHARQRGGFPRAGGAGDQENSAGAAADLAGHFGQADLLEGKQRVGNSPQHHGGESLLLEDGDAEASLGAVGKAEVAAALLFKFLLDALGGDGLHQRAGVFAVEHLGLELAHVPVKAQHGGLADREVKVGGLAFNHSLKQAIDLERRHRSLGLNSNDEIRMTNQYSMTK